MMTRSAKIASLENELKKEMGDLHIMLRDPAVSDGHKTKIRHRLTQLENLLLSELDTVKGNTEIRRRELRQEIEEDTKRRHAGGA